MPPSMILARRTEKWTRFSVATDAPARGMEHRINPKSGSHFSVRCSRAPRPSVAISSRFGSRRIFGGEPDDRAEGLLGGHMGASWRELFPLTRNQLSTLFSTLFNG